MSDEGITLIVGLGNPGPRYHHTRHNAGAWFLEVLLDKYGGTLRPEAKFFGDAGRTTVAGREVRLLLPSTYMNHSGKAVAAMANYYKIPPPRMLIAYDELDLPLGVTRLKSGGGSGGHKGVKDIISALGSGDFLRLRIGIGHPGSADRVLGHVLNEPSREEAEIIRADIGRALDVVPLLVEGKPQVAMNRLHTRPEPELPGSKGSE